jgi:osomolarity two-component system sensor histidine kinase SLN1
MRVAIREQLTLLIIVAALIGLAVVSIPTWIYVTRFVLGVRRDGLALTASLKASRITAELELLQQSCGTISSRMLVQRALNLYYNNRDDDAAWDDASEDIRSALSASTMTGLLQTRIYSRNTTGGSGPLLGVTRDRVADIRLPYADPDDGSAVYLSNTTYGYPASLYPNITYLDLERANSVRPDQQAFAAEPFPGVRISTGEGLLLGPLVINSTFALVSLSIPIRDNSDNKFILGYMTVVATASSLLSIRDTREGLGDTGMVLIVGPMTAWNRFNASLPPSNATFAPDRDKFGNLPVHYVVPLNSPAGQEDRHEVANTDVDVDSEDPFVIKDYPAVLASFVDQSDAVNGQDAYVSTTNELGRRVAAGWARTSTPLVNWTVIVEQTRDEAYAPITTLRKILLGTVFGTVGLLLLIVFPCAHLSVMPIRRLKDATEKTIQPPGYDETEYTSDLDDDNGDETPTSGNVSSRSHRSEKGLIASVKKFINRRTRGRPSSDNGRETTRRIFKIPGKVEDKPHFITDELTELTRTFNDMSDELVRQVSSLDQKVADRTRELEISKKAAEAANESKTLFIANISHELKTPLNGILGMCAVCMEETNLARIQASLKTLYKSGDLLLHLLEDLLSFSKNQIGQQLSLEEREFGLADIRSQILTIFDKQVREGRINFSVTFSSNHSVSIADDANAADGAAAAVSEKLPALGPAGMGRLKDMCLWGDQHRVLQVIINLVSNSLKFTPPDGTVAVRIKCLEEVVTPDDDASRVSSSPRSSTVMRGGRTRHRVGSSGSTNSRATTTASAAGQPRPSNATSAGTALSINPMDPRTATAAATTTAAAGGSSPSNSTPSPAAGAAASAPPARAPVHIRERSPSPPPPNARQYMFAFEVEDTGPGIPEHMQQRVFEPFVQGDLGLSKKFGGTGLGLSICHQLATLMGGTIKLDSTVGVGSKFTMRIPLRYVKDR